MNKNKQAAGLLACAICVLALLGAGFLLRKKAAALVLYALGVDEDTIMEDFLLTNEVFQENIAKTEAGLKAAGYDDVVVGEAKAMAGVKGEYLTAAFDAVKKEYGSIDDYIRNQLGVSADALHQLREKYLEKNPEDKCSEFPRETGRQENL